MSSWVWGIRSVSELIRIPLWLMFTVRAENVEPRECSVPRALGREATPDETTRHVTGTTVVMRGALRFSWCAIGNAPIVWHGGGGDNGAAPRGRGAPGR